MRSFWPEPSWFITQISSWPSLELVKAIRLPSGDQACPPLEPSDVSWVSPEPSAFITQMSTAVPVVLVKVILIPSGDQAGHRSCAASFVSRVWSEPSSFIT